MTLNESLLLEIPSNASFNAISSSTKNDKVRKSLNFVESTPKSILKKRNKDTVSEKKRKLSFRDTFSDQMEKIQKIEDESMAGEPLSPTKVDESKTNMAEDVSKMIVCPTVQIEEIMVLESSRSDEIDDRDDTKFWKHNLVLTEEDKNDIINKKKISSRHINAVNILLNREIGNKINGLQLSELVPVKLQHQNRWVMKFPMDPVSSPACQVHHTHHDHWVSTIFHRGNIYLLDSLGSERKDDVIIPDGLKIQISQIYGREKRRNFNQNS